MNETPVIDPVELVKDLADKIGIHQLYAIVKDLRGEGTVENNDNCLRIENENIKAELLWNKTRVARLEGEIDGLKYAIRCNGVSGGDVR